MNGTQQPTNTTESNPQLGPSAASLDPERAQAFAERTLDQVNGGFLSLMMSIGHQTALFDAMAALPPSSSSSIASACGLNERYVREWLAAMVMGKIIEYDPARQSYFLPPEHAACLTRAAGPDNLADLAQFVALLGEVEQSIIDVFKHGGGLDYEAFPRFHALMAENSRAVLEATLLTHTIQLVSGLVEKLEAGIDVVDVGCGRGDAVLLLAARFPRSQFAGIDFSQEAITWARQEAKSRKLENARFEVRDASTLSGPPTYDLVTAFDAIHDQAKPRRVLRGIRESLRRDGVFLMVDIAASTHLENNAKNPVAPFLYTVSTMHCTAVSLAQGGEGLGACWGEEKARELLAEAGFSHVSVERVEGDDFNAYFVCRVA